MTTDQSSAALRDGLITAMKGASAWGHADHESARHAYQHAQQAGTDWEFVQGLYFLVRQAHRLHHPDGLERFDATLANLIAAQRKDTE